MPRSLLVAACLISVTTLAACGEPDPPAEAGEAEAPLGPTWHADVAPILDAHCNRCHTGDGAVAPYQFDTYDAAVELMPLWWSTIESGRMPPWQADDHSAPMLGDFSLSAAQTSTIAAWIEGDMPEGDAASPGEPVVIADLPFERRDLTLEMPVDFAGTPGVNDEYRCFVLDWPVDEATYITGLETEPGNDAAVHHVVYYVVSPEAVPKFEGFDAAEPEPGYPCYARPVPPGDRDPSTMRGAQPIMGWVPGLAGRSLSPGTGFRIEPGSKMVMQMHYYRLGDRGETDRTRVHLTLEPTVERPLCNVPMVDPRWLLLPEQMQVPAGQTDVHHRYAAVPSQTPGRLVCNDVDLSAPILAHSIIPHMHTLGQRIEVAVERADARELVVGIPGWDFDWQLDYVLADAAYIAPDETLAVDCWFDNTEAARQRAGWTDTTVSDVYWGDGTGDEMCLAFVQVSNL